MQSWHCNNPLNVTCTWWERETASKWRSTSTPPSSVILFWLKGLFLCATPTKQNIFYNCLSTWSRFITVIIFFSRMWRKIQRWTRWEQGGIWQLFHMVSLWLFLNLLNPTLRVKPGICIHDSLPIISTIPPPTLPCVRTPFQSSSSSISILFIPTIEFSTLAWYVHLLPKLWLSFLHYKALNAFHLFPTSLLSFCLLLDRARIELPCSSMSSHQLLLSIDCAIAAIQQDTTTKHTLPSLPLSAFWQYYSLSGFLSPLTTLCLMPLSMKPQEMQHLFFHLNPSCNSVNSDSHACFPI